MPTGEQSQKLLFIILKWQLGETLLKLRPPSCMYSIVDRVTTETEKKTDKINATIRFSLSEMRFDYQVYRQIVYVETGFFFIFVEIQ